MLQRIMVRYSVVVFSQFKHRYKLRFGSVFNHLFVIVWLLFVSLLLFEEDFQYSRGVQVVLLLLIAVVDGDIFDLSVGILGFNPGRKKEQSE